MSTAIPTLPAIPDERPGVRRLTWVLVALAAVLVPHALHLPPAITVFAAALGAWRLAAERLGWRMLPDWVRLLGALIGFAAVLLAFRTINGPVAGTALLVVMLALKLTETVRVRDCLVLVFLGYFLVFAEFLYSQDIWVALWMMGATWLLTAVFLGVSHPTALFDARAALASSGRLLAIAVPIVVVMFFLFPRVPGPMWGTGFAGSAAVAGLGDKMDPGSISNLALSDEVAFRVEFFGSAQPTQLYWRGPTLHNFDGRAWTIGALRPPARGGIEHAERTVRYAVTLEPHNRPWMYALEMPVNRPPGARFHFDFLLAAEREIRERKRYIVESAGRYAAGAADDPAWLRRALALPYGSNPRATELAAELRRAAPDDDWAVVQATLARFRQQPYVYTLQPPLLGAEPVDEFLFETRRGFCEHYASAFTFLMRAAGIPARVVTGYLGGQWNPLGEYWIVRQSDAHAWSEVWIGGRGWVRVDPTAAIAPGRVERTLADVLPALERVPGAAFRQVAWLTQLRYGWDAVNNGWNQWVLAYGPELQQSLLARLGFKNASWQALVTWMGALVLALLALLAARLAWLNRPPPPEPVQRAWLALCVRLEAAGLARAPHEGPLDFARRAAAALPAEAGRIEALAVRYATLRYGPSPPAAEVAAFRRAVAAFEIR